MMLGAMWGLFAAAQRYRQTSDQALTTTAQAS